MTIADYLNFWKKLLREGNYKTYEVSEMLGYREASYFSRLFENQFFSHTNSWNTVMRLVNHGDLLYNFIQKIILCKKVQIVFAVGHKDNIAKKPVVKFSGLIYGDFSELARVNGEPVYVKEYKMKLLSNTTEVIKVTQLKPKKISAPTAGKKKGIGRHCGSKGSTDTCKGKGNY